MGNLAYTALPDIPSWWGEGWLAGCLLPKPYPALRPWGILTAKPLGPCWTPPW